MRAKEKCRLILAHQSAGHGPELTLLPPAKVHLCVAGKSIGLVAGPTLPSPVLPAVVL